MEFHTLIYLPLPVNSVYARTSVFGPERASLLNASTVVADEQGNRPAARQQESAQLRKIK